MELTSVFHQEERRKHLRSSWQIDHIPPSPPHGIADEPIAGVHRLLRGILERGDVIRCLHETLNRLRTSRISHQTNSHDLWSEGEPGHGI